MTGDDLCAKLRAQLWKKMGLVTPHPPVYGGKDAMSQWQNAWREINALEDRLSRYCGGAYQQQQAPAPPAAAIKASSPGQATPVPPTSYVGQGSQKQQPAFGMAAAQKKPPAFGGAGFRQY